MKIRRGVVAGLALAIVCRAPALASSPAAAAGEPWFEEVARRAGIDFVTLSGHAGRHLLPENQLGGAGLFDLEGDGDLDVYLVQGGSLSRPGGDRGRNRLFRNDGAGDDGHLIFADVSAGSGADHRGYGIGVASGDVDNDRDADLHVTNLGPNVLLRNDGGTFTDVTGEAGVGDPRWSSSAAFFDFDADGDLDLFVANYVNWSAAIETDCYHHGRLDYCSPINYSAPAADTLYRNDGSGADERVRFTDISEQAGLRMAFGNGLGVATGDFDGDGTLDVFVANDLMVNQLWLGDGRGRFRDEALLRGVALDESGKAKAGMGVMAADPDDDGDLDLLVVNLTRESDSFYRNEGEYFLDRTIAAGLIVASRPFTRFGAGMADFDNDGHLDLYQASGAVLRLGQPLSNDPYAQPNLLFRGLPGGRFREVRPRGGTAELLVFTSRAAAFGDVDNDGGVDVLIANRDGPTHLLRNIVANRGHWLRFKVLEGHGRDALGATVTLELGDRTLRRDVQTAYSYCAANDPRVHFGLGKNKVTRNVKVRWIDGETENFGDLEADRTVVLERGKGETESPTIRRQAGGLEPRLPHPVRDQVRSHVQTPLAARTRRF